MEHKNNRNQGTGNPLGYAPIAGLIGRFAIPSIISMLVTAIYNITDQIFIGHVVGMLGNGATNVVFPTVTFTTGFALLIGVGTASNFNLNMGARQEETAKQFLGTGLTLMSIAGVLLMCLFLVFKTPILLLCGATENTLPYSQLYLGVTAFGIPFFLFTSASAHLIRADGSPAYSMICNVTGAVLNIFLDWLFLYVCGWGIRGAAAATVIGQIVSCGLCLYYFAARFKTFKIVPDILGLRGQYVLQIARLGVSNFINHNVMTLVNIVMNNTLTHYGALSIYGSDIPLAVSGVIAKLNSILSAFAVGLAQGCQPIWGFNMGAKNYDRVKTAYKKAFLLALSISILFFFLFQLFPRQIVGIFGTGEELYFQFAERYVRTFMLLVCVFGVQPLTVNYFTGVGSMRQGVVLSLSRQGFFLIPLLVLLPMRFGIDGALYAGPIADALAFGLSLTLVTIHFKKMTAAQAEQP